MRGTGEWEFEMWARRELERWLARVREVRGRGERHWWVRVKEVRGTGGRELER